MTILARVISLKFNPVVESFDDEPLRAFIKDKEIHAIGDHFFKSYSRPSAPAVKSALYPSSSFR